MTHAIENPFTQAKIRKLAAGDTVSLSGRIYTGRDRLHRYLFEGGKSPVDLRDGVIYHSGPIMLRREGEWIVRAAGPTTSARLDPYMPGIIERNHVRVIVGKGGMGEETRQACMKYGCVYVQVVGGAASVLAKRVEQVTGVHLVKEFGMSEALWELVVKGLEGVVSIDTRGRSLHRRTKTSSRRNLKQLVA